MRRARRRAEGGAAARRDGSGEGAEMTGGERRWLRAAALAAVVAAWVGPAAAQDGPAVADGMAVSLEFTLTLPDRTVLDSNVGKAPLTYIQGRGPWPRDLERALLGMKAGQRKRVSLAAARAYGPYDKAARVTLPRGIAPPGVQVGGFLEAPDGRTMKVLEVTDQTLVLDLNHPLAGKDVVFEVTVLKVERPTKAPAAGAP